MHGILSPKSNLLLLPPTPTLRLQETNPTQAVHKNPFTDFCRLWLLPPTLSFVLKQLSCVLFHFNVLGSICFKVTRQKNAAIF